VRNPYDVLGVSRAADDAEIHAAYRTLAKRYHPDLHPGDPGAEARFKELAAAYELLSDGLERARYDREHPAASDAGHDRHTGVYTAERGYQKPRDDTVEWSKRPARRQRGPLNVLLIAFGLWALLSYSNGLLRGFTTALDGTIERRDSITTPLAHTLFFRGDLSLGGYADVYTIRSADGAAQTFIAGPRCSLLNEHPRTGARIHKEAWAWRYELDGREASDFTAPRAISCALQIPFRLLFVFGPLLLGLFWRAER
jgi:curved DNA-binding protein CbpA